MGVRYSSMTLRVFLLGFASFVTCWAQSGGSRQLRPQAFVPSRASTTKQMSVDFEGDRVAEIVQMYLSSQGVRLRVPNGRHQCSKVQPPIRVDTGVSRDGDHNGRHRPNHNRSGHQH